MKKLLSLLTISILATSVTAPLLANAPLTSTKRGIGVKAKDATTGFNIKIKEKYNAWKLAENIYVDKVGKDKWYLYVLKLSLDEDSEYILDLYNAGNPPENFKHGYQSALYRWDGVGEPNLPEINKKTGKIANWNIDKTIFQQGILFSLADGSKTAKWSNNGMRLTVDGETNININNPNVTEIYWDGVKQNMLEHKVNINVKPETSEKTHKLVIKYDINGTKYTSEDIDVVMATKIEPMQTPAQQNLSDLVKMIDLGKIENNNDDTIKTKIIENNSLAIDFSKIKITDKTDTQATLSAIESSKSYQGSVVVKYNISSATTVDLKIDLTSSASGGVQIDKNYLAQLDKSKMTNKVNTFYYANGKSVIKIKQPPTGNVITGKVYGCDDKWNKTSQSSNIDTVSGLEIDKGKCGSVDGRYLIELQHKDLPTHTKNIYLQVSEQQKVEHYWDTPNGKQFEQWAEDNEEKNIRGYSTSQLNNLFELSKTWKQSLKHLDLNLDNFVVDNIQNVTQNEIDNYKTKMLTSVKAQVEKYIPSVVENTDYTINVDPLVAGDWTVSKDVKVQVVNGSTKLLSFTAKTIPVQQKEQPTPPTPDNNKKSGLSGWTIFGIIVGSLTGLFLFGWLLKKFVVNPFILEPIRKKKAKVFAEKTAKDIAQMKLDDEEWEAKRRGDK